MEWSFQAGGFDDMDIIGSSNAHVYGLNLVAHSRFLKYYDCIGLMLR